jgi:predicted anti-sigma-YlaC factor YlaD
MNCSTCQKNVSAYLEEKLPGEIQRSTESHLQNCKQCSKFYNEVEIAYSIIDREKASTFNPFLATRVMATIEQFETPVYKESVYKRVLQPILIAVSIAIAVFAGIKAGSLYTSKPTSHAVPTEMAMMNDAALESLNVYSTK